MNNTAVLFELLHLQSSKLYILMVYWFVNANANANAITVVFVSEIHTIVLV